MKVIKIAVCILVLAMFAACSNDAQIQVSVVIPQIENWDVVSSTVSNQKLFYTWRKDPRGNGLGGLVIYYMSDDKSWAPFVKAWHFYDPRMHENVITYDTTYDDKYCRVAMLLENGAWFVGELGEHLKFENFYNREIGPTKPAGIIFYFENDKKAFRKIEFK